MRVVLRTVDGAVDLLVEELRGMGSVSSVRVVAGDAVECWVDGSLEELARCALYSSAGMDELAWGRRFGSVKRLPWATNLVVAEVLVRLAKVRPCDLVLDPFCGTGTILRAVLRREPRARIVGVDRDRRGLAIAKRLPVVLGRAEAVPVADGSVDRVVANLPFGKQVGSHRENRDLYPAAINEIDRVLKHDGRVVLLTEDKRLLLQAVEKQARLKVVRRRLLKYNGASPTVYVLTRLR